MTQQKFAENLFPCRDLNSVALLVNTRPLFSPFIISFIFFTFVVYFPFILYLDLLSPCDAQYLCKYGNV